MKNIILLIIIVILLWIYPLNVKPDSPLPYALQRVQENLNLVVRVTNNQKRDYYLYLLDKRLNELKYIVSKRDANYIETSSQRYAATAGRLSKLVSDPKQVKDKFDEHKQVLGKLRDVYESQDKAEWRLIQDDINYLDIYLSSPF